MKAIRRRNLILAVLAGLGLLTGVVLLLFGGTRPEMRDQTLLAGVMIVSGISVGFWVHEFRKLKIARLIDENAILSIHTAVISDISAEATEPEDTVNIEVMVSYFGILLGEKIIKFNQGGIRLRSVEIGDDFFSFTCGTEKRTWKIRLLRPAMDRGTMAEISERLRYETGITPTLLS